MDGVSLGITALDGGQTIFNDLPNTAISVNNQSDLNGISLRSNITEKSCLCLQNPTWGYLGTDTAASTIFDESCLFAPKPTWGYTYIDSNGRSYSTNQVVKETPVNNQLSVKIRKKIKICCSL